MLAIETRELNISSTLKKKIEMIGKFTNTKPIIKNGCVKSVMNTNIAYAMPHIVRFKDINYLIFDECEDVYVNDMHHKIKFKDLEWHIKSS